MTVLQTMFSFDGKIGRARYALFHIPIILFNIGMGRVLRYSYIDQDAAVFFSILSLVLIYVSFALMAKRLHDIGQSGWMSLLVFIPFINIALLLYLLFKKGQETTEVRIEIE